MTGTVDEPEFEYKTADLLAGVKQGIQREANTVKSILKAEMGLFKNDSTVAALPEKKPEQVFDIEWDDGEEEEETPKPGPAPKTQVADNSGRKRNSFRNVLNRVTQPEEHATTDEFDFEEDDL